ncbi:IclR family transcriptional regulator [Amycolatopsis sp. WQ 127309]|uniref:IclR family transcriptional regulator n=1 Tax=Amycolatopsis sp. WQ 127309 TaxID=2932773 RepID=UPI001FF69919|nr:helix-turn-helix domain-containing protein [Amycolatopsis sp. WQ 127309]UOZ06967.1 helix-turn-helix domain-containing protein [Amycolatopsis sp. WQ 127309]
MSASPAGRSGFHDEPGGVPSAVDKAMLVLNAVLTDEDEPTLAELTRRTGLAKATVHRVLNVLHAHGMVERTDSRYGPGERLTGFGRPVDTGVFTLLRRESTAYLVELHRATGETASVSVLAGDVVHHVNQVYGHRSCRLPEQTPVGAGSSLSAISRILLAHSPAARTPLVPATELAAVRQAGIACSQDRSGALSTLAVTVPGYLGVSRPVALAVTGRAGRFDHAAAAKMLRNSAFAIARAVRVATSSFPAEGNAVG